MFGLLHKPYGKYTLRAITIFLGAICITSLLIYTGDDISDIFFAEYRYDMTLQEYKSTEAVSKFVDAVEQLDSPPSIATEKL